jgi:TRAP-type C4-dicarboxylate transport system substrate-binding protein
MFQRRLLIVLLLIASVSITFASGNQEGSSQGEIPELIIASSNAPDCLLSKMGERLEANINQSGVLKAHFIVGQSLGDMRQVMEQHMQGSVDIAFDRPLWFAPFVSDFQVLSWGFTFRNREHLAHFYTSDIYKAMVQKVKDKMGITILYSVPDQSRVMFSRVPINSVDDIQGITMRVPRIETYIELWKTFGAKPTQVDWSEAFTALRTGVVDAAESDISSAWSQRFHQAAKHVILTNHVMMGIFVSVNNETLEKLDTEQYKALYDAVVEAMDWASSQSEKEVAKTIKDMQDLGAIITKIDIKPFQEKSYEGVLHMEEKDIWPKGLYDKIQQIQ